MERSSKTYSAPSFAGDSNLADAGSSYDLMLRFIGRDKRVLEFGCASGYMSRMLSQCGCRVTGIELNPAAAAEARHYCESVLVADLDARALEDVLPETTFDVAVFGDVLEHLRDPWRVLDDARRFVAPGGFVVLSIPNVAHGSVRLSLLSGKFAYKDAGLLDDTHIRFFTLEGIIDLCLRAGYRIDAIDRTRMPIFSESPYLPNVHADEFDPVTIDRVGADPEAETFQFVVKATPLDDAGKREAIYKEFLRVRSELDALRRTTRSGVTLQAPHGADAAAEDPGAELERVRREFEDFRASQNDVVHLLSSQASEARALLDVERAGSTAAIADANERAARAEQQLEERAASSARAEAAHLALTVEYAELRIDAANRAFERDVANEARTRAELAVAAMQIEHGTLREKLKAANAALAATEERAASRYEALRAQLQHTRAEFEQRTREMVENETEAHRVSVAFAELGVLHRGLSDHAAERHRHIEALEATIERLETAVAEHADTIAAHVQTIAVQGEAIEARERSGGELEAALAAERARREAAHAIFAEYLDYEIANAKYQTAVVDAMLQRYRASKWWALKSLFGDRGKRR